MSGWDISAFANAWVAHMRSELSAHAGGVGDEEIPGDPQKTAADFPFHICYVLNGVPSAGGVEENLWTAPAMTDVTVQVTTVAQTRAQRDWAEREAYEAAMADMGTWTIHDGRTGSVLTAVRSARQPGSDDLNPQVAQRFIYTVAVSA